MKDARILITCGGIGSLSSAIAKADAPEEAFKADPDRRLERSRSIVKTSLALLWRNPSADTVCRIAFILIKATPVAIGGRVLDELHP